MMRRWTGAAISICVAVLSREAAADRSGRPLLHGSECGNGVIDGLPTQQITCAPCLPNRPCRCSGRPRTEQCDGHDLGNQSCASLGHDGGDLRCTKRCTFDESGCYRVERTPPHVPSRTLGKVALGGARVDGPLLAASADQIGAVWIANPSAPSVHFARFGRALHPVDGVRSFGAYTRAAIAPADQGWLLAASAASPPRTVLHPIAADGQLGPELAAFDGYQVELLALGLLALRTMTSGDLHRLSVVTLDRAGKPAGPPIEVFPASGRGPAPLVTLASTPAGRFLLRSSDSSGTDLAKLDAAGKVTPLPSPVSPGMQQARVVGFRSGLAVMFVEPRGLALQPIDAAGKRTGASRLLAGGVDQLDGLPDGSLVVGRQRGAGAIVVVRDGVADTVSGGAAIVARAAPFGRAYVLAWTTRDSQLVLAPWIP